MSDNKELYKGVLGKLDAGVKIVEVPPAKPNRPQRRAMKKKA